MKGHYAHIVLALLLASLPTAFVFSQEKTKDADKAYNQYKYAVAVALYKKSYHEKNPDYRITQRIATCYRLMDNSREAETWYAKVVQLPQVEPENFFYYAEALQSNGKYAQAKAQYIIYQGKAPAEKAKTAQRVTSCDLAMEWTAKPERFDIKPETVLNTDNADFSPARFENGILFATDRKDKVIGIEKPTANNVSTGWTGRPYLKLYTAERDSAKQKWKQVDALPDEVNENFHNGPGVYNASTKTLYFTRTRSYKIRQYVNHDPTSWVESDTAADRSVARLEIYSSKKQNNNKWSKPRPFQYNKATAYSVGHPALSPDGKILYFTSDMPGGQGNTDLYYCEKLSDSTWSKPVNLGNTINTVWREGFPVVDEAGNLYFSSDGHPGMGSLDIFMSQGEKASWSAPKNLKYPLNSSKDDFGILYDKDHQGGYLSSNRGSEAGTDDIYRFSYIPLPPVVLLGRIFKKQPDGKLVSMDTVQVLIYRGDSIKERLSSGPEGGFKAILPRNNKTYTIKGSKDQYFTATTSVTANKDTVYAELVLEQIIINKPVVIKNIYYDLDKWDIRADAEPELDKIVNMMNDNPGIRIELSSHTDSRAGDRYNLTLSQKRAAAAVNYIVSKGIKQERITAKGYGETQLLNHCKNGVKCTEEEHQLNRRTEFKVLGFIKVEYRQ